MKKEFLEELLANVDGKDEIIGKIFAEYGKEVNTLKAQVEEQKKAVTEANAKLDGYKDYDSLKEANTKLQADLEASNKALADKDFDYAYKDALKDSKVKDPKTLEALLDRSKVSYKEGKLDGFEDQIKALKESHSYLFDSESGGQLNVKPKDLNNGVSAETIALRNL